MWSQVPWEEPSPAEGPVLGSSKPRKLVLFQVRYILNSKKNHKEILTRNE